MPEQLIYTSAPRGLQAGRSGYCTVARTRNLREGLILPLEQLSTYTHLMLPGQEATVRNPVIHLYRRLVHGGTEYRVLSRIVDAGADHTGRSNFLAHHLIFENEWRDLPSPAAILRDWPGWRDRWDAAPGYVDDIATDEFKALGQAGGLPSATNPEYLAKGWENTFTTFLQEGDSTADFHWMGTREAPDPAKKIAKLFGASPAEQAANLEQFAGVISAPNGDETKLLELIAHALGHRSQAAEREALAQAQQSLESSYAEMERLAKRAESVIADTLEVVADFREKHESSCQRDKPMQLYQNCLADEINPAKDSATDHESRRRDAFNQAKAEYQAAKDRIDSGQFPDSGISSGHLDTLRTLESTANICRQKLNDGIQLFEAQLLEHDREEQQRRDLEAEERRRKQAQQAAQGRVKAYDDKHFSGIPSGHEKTGTNWKAIAAIFLVLIVLLTITTAITVSLMEIKNPIVYLVHPTNEQGLSYKSLSYHLDDEKNRIHEFYGFYDTIDIRNEVKDWKTKKSKEKVEAIKKEYKNNGLIYIKEDEGSGSYEVGMNDDGSWVKKPVPEAHDERAKKIVGKLLKEHRTKFLWDEIPEGVKTEINVQYKDIEALHKELNHGDGEGGVQGDPGALIELEQFRPFEKIALTNQVAQLQKWNNLYKEANDEISEFSASQRSELHNRLNTAIDNWRESIQESIEDRIKNWPDWPVEGVESENPNDLIAKLEQWFADVAMLEELMRHLPPDSKKIEEQISNEKDQWSKKLKEITGREPAEQLDQMRHEWVLKMVSSLRRDNDSIMRSLEQVWCEMPARWLSFWVKTKGEVQKTVELLTVEDKKDAESRLGEVEKDLERRLVEKLGKIKAGKPEDYLDHFKAKREEEKKRMKNRDILISEAKAERKLLSELSKHMGVPLALFINEFGEPDDRRPFTLIYRGKGYDSKLCGGMKDLWVSWRQNSRPIRIKMPGSGPGRIVQLGVEHDPPHIVGFDFFCKPK